MSLYSSLASARETTVWLRAWFLIVTYWTSLTIMSPKLDWNLPVRCRAWHQVLTSDEDATVSTKTMFLSYTAHRAHPGSNWGPIDLQSMALPLSYTPGTVCRSPGCFWMSLTTLLGLVGVVWCLFGRFANSVAAMIPILIDGVYWRSLLTARLEWPPTQLWSLCFQYNFC